MNILVVDASRKKAAIRSRRILSKYLEALGTDTFAGRMSEEGLIDLIKELREVASRHTAIAVHRVATRDTLELVTIVGSKDFFDETGRWAFKTRTIATNAAAPAPMVEFLMNLSTIAGLVHDIGKVNYQFQAALIGNAGPQRIRHDVLGAMLFLQAVKLCFTNTASNDWVVHAASDPAKLFEPLVLPDGSFNCANLSAQGLRDEASLQSNLYKEGLSSFLFNANARSKLPEASAVFYLTLTHHHHIRKGRYGTAGANEPSLWRHVQEAIPLMADQNLKAPTSGLPWHDLKWCETFKAAAQNLLRIKTQHPQVLQELTGNQLKTFTSTCSQLLRPSLLIADQGASTMQEDVRRNTPQGLPQGTVRKQGTLYANRWGNNDLMGDTLTTHLHSVGRRNRSMTRLLLEPAAGLFPMVSAPRPETGSLMCSMPEPGSKFYWQRQAQEQLEAIPDIQQAPFFAAILSAPGSGKTAGGPRVLSAVCRGQLRFSLGVGRRSLTLQTGDAYEQLLKFDAKDVATMVGDSAARMLYASDNAPATNPKEERQAIAAEQASLPQQGSECLSGEADDFVFDKESLLAARGTGPWLGVVQPAHKITSGSGFLSQKTIRLIDTPVLVATIDHLAGAAALQKTKDAHLLLRISNSDLILDELDDLSPHDLVTIGKLVHLYGMYGRRVIVMSGTLNNYLAKQMFEVWKEGLTIHRALTGNKVDNCLALISNLTPPTILREPDAARMDAAVNAFCGEFAQQLQAQPARTVADILPLPTLGTKDKPVWMEAIAAASFGLHERFKVQDPVTGVWLTMGAVRFNTVRNAQRFAGHLLNRTAREGEPQVKVICYHAKFPTLLRALIEKELDALLLRESYAIPQAQEFGEHPKLREALNDCKAEGISDLCIILSTTSIEETGRNHDLDWAISEPHSERSLAQLAGRVLRHRRKVPGEHANVLVLSTTLNGLEGSGVPYGSPGVQGELFTTTDTWLVTHPDPEKSLASALHKAGLRYRRGPVAREVRAAELLPFEAWKTGVTPAPVLVAPSDYESRRLAALQHLEMRAALEASKDIFTKEPAPLALREYLDCANSKQPLGLTSVHHEQVRFRDGEDHTKELCMTLDPENRFIVVVNGVPAPGFPAPHLPVFFLHPERDFFQWEYAWEPRVDALCKQNGWEKRAVMNVLCRGLAPWGQKAEELLLTQNRSFRFSFELGLQKLADN